METEVLKSQKKNPFLFRIFSALKSKRFKRAFRNGFKSISLSIILVFFLRRLKSVAAANDFPEVPFDRLPLDRIKAKRKWYDVVRPFFTLEIAGKAMGALTGLLLLGTLIALDAQIRQTENANLDLAGAKEYIDILLKACESWKDPGTY